MLDAARAIEYVDLAQRVELRTMLGATLVKHAHHQAMFAELFDRHFPVRLPPRQLDPQAVEPTHGHRRIRTITARRPGRARTGVLDPDADRQLLVERIVDRFAGLDDGTRTERYHLYRVLRAIDLAAILSAAIARARRDGEPVDRAELDARVESLRAMIADEIRARLDDAAADSAHRSIEPGRTADPFDVELARASASELDDIRAAIRPLARRLAAQLRHRRQSRA